MADPVTPKSKRSWTRIALVLSLGMNLLIVGLVVGVLASGGHKDGRRSGPPQAGQVGIGPLMDSLPSDVRRSMGRDMRRALKAEGRGWNVSQGNRAELAALLQAPELDTAALEAELNARLELMSKVQAEAGAIVVSRIAGMSLEDRTAVAERLMAWTPKRPKPGGPRKP